MLRTFIGPLGYDLFFIVREEQKGRGLIVISQNDVRSTAWLFYQCTYPVSEPAHLSWRAIGLSISLAPSRATDGSWSRECGQRSTWSREAAHRWVRSTLSLFPAAAKADLRLGLRRARPRPTVSGTLAVFDYQHQDLGIAGRSALVRTRAAYRRRTQLRHAWEPAD